ncbi:MBL fold metallo-hydrolase [Conexibacter sp. W3-3-2]|uniref:MBL fold metallo-hydrolase n=1 Tax=Paraconexibacter algicola TaxID=2133960 RepID=A0A2T4UDY1_9ACTN|nr:MULTISPECIES: MBL fold metallo-hydrolase [Solirubrobacterales]MTD43980.1 MBL fold metallo-hydrolase [Conexibacter sp. W3-3-2]PTL55711.1 MBL fold metallo-hydrolase [Paraconexibacter algicola]
MPVIHHLNCGTMCPHAGTALGLVDRDAGHLVARCLLIEAADGLVLIDTGYGTGDVATPSRLGPARFLLGARLAHEETAVAQVRALGHDPADVRDVLVTHLDLDHAGGLGDFPNATVHLHRREHEFLRGGSAKAKLRYRPGQLAHGPRYQTHEVTGEAWFGLERVRLLEGLDVEIAMIPLHGHTPGHTGYAVNTGDGWLLHAGDTYLRREEIEGGPVPRALRIYHQGNSIAEKDRRANVERLTELRARHGEEVTVFCSHDATELARDRAAGA